MDILLKGYAKMIIWINPGLRITGKSAVHGFITATSVIVTLVDMSSYKLIWLLKVVNFDQ